MSWRPPQWNEPLLYSVTVKSPSPNNDIPGREQTQDTTYYFDAVMRAIHDQQLMTTKHPIQNGASVTDHSYLLPSRVTLEIGMSDVMDRYSQGQYTSDTSKSVSAYKTFKDLQKSRKPLTVSTRLNVYSDMVITDIRAIEDSKTRHALRALLYFEQIIVANVAISRTESARPDQSTSATNEGTKQPEPVPPEIQKYLDELKTGSH